MEMKAYGVKRSDAGREWSKAPTMKTNYHICKWYKKSERFTARRDIKREVEDYLAGKEE